MSVVIETTLGDITVDLYVKERPRTCTNFLKLCKMKYYNLNLFHSVIRNFIAQTGDPLGTGRGGESIYGILYGEQARYYEAEKIPRIKHTKIGTISMVNCGDNMLGSQFFITLGPNIDHLDGEHCAFGEVVEGFEILVKLSEAICDEENRPYQDIRITHTVILDDPFNDPDGLEIPSRSPSPSQEMLDSGRIGADEEIDDTKGKSLEELEEIIQEKEAKARATILEMVGDLPDAEIAPPENVLFVCKLNPVTTDEDLEIIFSRFGRINSCEVIRDQKTKESLQYAFVEFDDRKACEDAYFKMDNVLIDDRRIHVDFSQSVSKYKWKGKGRGVQVFEDKKPEKNSFQPKNPWILSQGDSKQSTEKRHTNSSENRPSEGRGHHHSYDESRKHWSRSPPRYSRGHATEQRRKYTSENTKSSDRNRRPIEDSRRHRSRSPRSPPRHSRGPVYEQSPPRHSKGPAYEEKVKSTHKGTDDKILALLKKELLEKNKRKKKKHKEKGKKKRKSKKGKSSSDSSDGTSSSSSSSESDSSENEPVKSKKAKK